MPKSNQQPCIVSLKKDKTQIEILCKWESVLGYREGRLKRDQVLLSEQIYTNAKEGRVASQQIVESVLGDTHGMEAVEYLLQKGDFSLTTNEQRQIQALATRQLVQYILDNFTQPNGSSLNDTMVHTALEKAHCIPDPKSTPEGNYRHLKRKLQSQIILKEKDLTAIPLNLTISLYRKGAVERLLGDGANQFSKHWLKGCRVDKETSEAHFEFMVPPTHRIALEAAVHKIAHS